MGKKNIESTLMERPFSDLTISEKAAVLKERFENEASMPGALRIKNREAIGEEYGLSGSSVGRLLKLNDLIDPLKDMVDCGALYAEVAVQLAFLPENEQQMVYKVAKETGTKLTANMVIQLRSHTGMLTDGFVRRYLRKEPVKKKCYKVPGRIVEKYFRGLDPNMVDSIVEQALEAWFGKEDADV